MAEEENWTEVAMVPDDVEADLIRGFLESEGIEAQIDNRKFHMEPVNFGDLTGIRVLARPEDVERAKGLLSRRQRDFEKMQRAGDTSSILTDHGPTDAPEDPTE
jgi:putative signal transducing protein